MLVGEIPTQEEVENLTSILQRRSHVPSYVFETMGHCLKKHIP